MRLFAALAAPLFVAPLFVAFALPALAQDGYRVVADGFSDAGAAYQGVVPVQKDGVWGLIARDGTMVAPLGLEAVGPSGAGMFAVKAGGKWGLILASGQQVLNTDFEGTGTPSDLTPIAWKGQWWVFRSDGTFEDAPLPMDTLTGNDGDCFAGTAAGVATVERRGGQTQTFQPKGVTAIGAVSEGFVQVTLNGVETHLPCAYAEPTGDEPGWDQTRGVHQGVAAVRSGDLWGYAAPDTGGLVIPQTYANARDFSEGLAAVQGADGLWGYIDRRGQMAIAPRFDAAFGFSGGLAGVTLGGKRGFISYDGSFAIQPVFDDFWRHDGGAVAVKRGDFWAVIAPDQSDPATRMTLPLARLTAAQQKRPTPIEVVPSSPHAYFTQDIVSLHTVTFSPDQSVMVTALSSAGAQEFALWDFRSKKLIRKVVVDGMTSAVLLPGTEIMAVGMLDGAVALIDAISGQVLHRVYVHDTGVMDLILSPDGTKLATLAKGGVRVWDLTTGALVLSHDSEAQKIRFASDSQSLYVGTLGGALVQIGLDGSILLEIDGEPAPEGTEDWVNQTSRADIALSPAGVLAVMKLDRIEGADGLFSFVPWVEVTTATTRQRIDLPEGSRDVLTIDLSDDGRLLGYAGSTVEAFVATVGVIDLSTGTPTLSRALSRESVAVDGLEDGLLWVDKLVFVPGSSDLILVGGEGGDIWQMDTVANTVRNVIGRRLAPAQPAVGPTLSRVFTADGNGVLTVWDMSIGRIETRLDDPVSAGTEGVLGTNGTVIYLIDGMDETRFAMWDAETLMPLTTGPTLGFDPYDSATTAPAEGVQALLVRLGQPQYAPIKVFAGGKRAVLIDASGVGRVYDLPSGALLVTFLSDTKGEWLVLTPEGFFAASEGGGKLVSISRGLRSFAVDQVYQALYRPDLVAAKLRGDPDGTLAQAAARLDLTVILGSGPAPQTRFSFPPEGAKADDEVIEIGVEINDEGGGVGRIEWRVNGITVEVQARGAAALDASGDVARAKIGLEPGRNLIEVVAYNAAGLVASAPQSLTVDWDGVASLVPPALHVMAVGVNDYADGRLTLKYAAADARAFGDAIARAGAGVFGSVDVVTLLDGQVTDAGLDAAFRAMSLRVKPQDVFVFFLAGHGKTLDGAYYFIPADFSFSGDDPVRTHGISQDRWQEWMAGIKARKSVMIYDTCESGSVTETRSVDAALAQSAAVSRLTRAMGRTVLSASTDDAPALEGYQGHGVMTYALLQALGEGDANGNATIEVTELAGFLDRVVPEISQAAFNFRQVPQMSLKGSDFALGSAVMVLGDAPESFPATLTHVVAGGTPVLDAPGGREVRQIPQGVFFGVFKAEENAGFARIAKDGTAMGWVPLTALTPLQ